MNVVKHIANQILKYIGMDVHRDSTTVVVLDVEGKVLMEVTLRTEATALVDFVRGLSGTLYLTFEEGTYSAWPYDLLSPYVEKLIVCNPRKSSSRGNKSDRLDARKLAELLRGGQLSPVYHGPLARRTLKELAASYLTVVRDGTRVMNRLKAIYRGRGIRCAGKQVYSPRHRPRWLEQLKEPGTRQRAALLYLELDAVLKLRAPARRALLTEARKHPAYKILASIPGLGARGLAAGPHPNPLPLSHPAATVELRGFGSDHAGQRTISPGGRRAGGFAPRRPGARAESRTSSRTESDFERGGADGDPFARAPAGVLSSVSHPGD